MSRNRILFITPPYHCGVVEVAGRWVPLTFVYLAGAAREAGFEPVIYDAMTKGAGFTEIEQKIVEVGHKAPGKVMSYLFNLIRKSLNMMETAVVLGKIKALSETASDGKELTRKEKVS